MQQLYILGRQPALGMAELERLCGAGRIAAFGRSATLVDGEQPLFARLGGSIKSATVIEEVPFKNWGKLNAYLLQNAGTLFGLGDSGRHTLGVSIYGADIPQKNVNGMLLSLKKALRTKERSVRIIEHKDGCALESASVIHNGLLAETGRELVVAIDGSRAIIGLTKHEQDIESYTLRDRGRPKRDAKVGMLPPKLAQIITNLTHNPSVAEAESSCEIPDFIAPKTLLDPFCGTGVLLQEAALMGLRVYGSDIDERMVRYARDNINWLQDQMQAYYPWELEIGDATAHTWRPPIDTVAGETYLGTPLLRLPAPPELDAIVKECDDLHRKFLTNIAPQLKTGTPLCLAVPAWRVRNSFRHLPVIDELRSLGYNRVDFKHVRHSDLVYHREGQFVARELIVLTRK